jgi:membrane protease YdiL (CAAX protease family)
MPLLKFFSLALALSWLAWIPFAASRAGLIPVALPAELTWLGEYGPALAALILTWRQEGRAAAGRLFARLGTWRVSPWWYLAAIGLTPAVILVVLAAMALAGRQPPDPALLGGWAERFQARTAAFSPSMGLISGLNAFMAHGWWQTLLVFTSLAVANGGISEEPGWRGWLLPKLQPRYGTLIASLLVAVCWAFWHTGSNFWQVVLASDLHGALRFVPGYLGQYLVLVAPLAVYYTWVYNGTDGSLLLVVLLHASYNMTVSVILSAWPAFPVSWMVATLWCVAGVVAVVCRNP